MDKDETNVEEMLRTLYVQNEQYHDTKERGVWLAGVVYFAFSLFVLPKIPDSVKMWETVEPPLIKLTTVFLTLLFGITFEFISRQTYHRNLAAVASTNFRELIKKLDKEQLSYNRLESQTNFKKAREGMNFFRQGWPGVLVLAGCLVFYATQMLLLYTVVNDKDLVFFGIWVSAIIYSAFFFIRCCFISLQAK